MQSINQAFSDSKPYIMKQVVTPKVQMEGGAEATGELTTPISAGSPSSAGASSPQESEEESDDSLFQEQSLFNEPEDNEEPEEELNDEELEGEGKGEGQGAAPVDPMDTVKDIMHEDKPQEPNKPENLVLGMGESEGSTDAALAAELKDILDTAGLKGNVEVREEKRGTVISLGEAAFFRSGRAEVMA